MTQAEKIASIKPAMAWAWAISVGAPKEHWVICFWTCSTRTALLRQDKPSPEAIPVRVLLTPVVKEKIARLTIKPERRWYWSWMWRGQRILGTGNSATRAELMARGEPTNEDAIPVRVLLTPVVGKEKA